MVAHLEPVQVEKYLMHMLAPVYRITEDDTIRDPHLGKCPDAVSSSHLGNIASIDELKTLAVELQDLIQTKVGTTKFSIVYNNIRQNVLGLRQERKTKKAVQVGTDIYPR